MSPNKKIGILFVCMGNICRSPALHGIMEHLIKEKNLTSRFFIESCGIRSTFLGASPDRRMQKIATQNGISLNNKAKPFEPHFFEVYDAIFAVDQSCLHFLKQQASSEEERSKLHLATAFSTQYKNLEIVDPFLGGEEGFRSMWEMLVDSCEGIIKNYCES